MRCAAGGPGKFAASSGWSRGADNFFFADELVGGKARIGPGSLQQPLFARDSGYMEAGQHSIVLLRGRIEALSGNP